MSNRNKRQNYYAKSAKRNKQLEPGMRGFLCSCNTREKDCVRESYNILNKYADLLLGPEHPEYPEDTNEVSEDISDELASEVKKMKSDNTEPLKRRFQVVDSGAKNILFIKTTVSDTVALASGIVEDVYKTGVQQTRFLIRLVPIEVTCKAYLNDIKLEIEKLAEKYFKEAPKSFSIIFNHRNNSSVNRDEVIKAVAEIIASKNQENKVNLKEAEVSVVIEVIRGVALIAVIPDYLKYKKFNLHVGLEDDKRKSGGNGEESQPADSTEVASLGAAVVNKDEVTDVSEADK